MYGLSDDDLYGDKLDSFPGDPLLDDHPDDPDPAPSGPAAVGLLVRAPKGVAAPRPTLAVYAVVEEPDEETGEPEVAAGVALATGLTDRMAGHRLAFGHSLHPDKLGFRATAVILNDGTGKTLGRYPVLRVA